MSMKKSIMGTWRGKLIRGRGPKKQAAAAAKLRRNAATKRKNK